MNNALEKWGNVSRCFQIDYLSTLAGTQNIDPMDPLCISLVQEYLDSTKSDLADQFKNKYQPKSGNMTLKEVMSKWKEEQLARGLVYQHLRKVAPSLALEFSKSYPCSSDEVPKQLIDLVEEEQLARCIVFQHLKRVTPALAPEFKNNHHCFLENPPEHLMKLIEDAQKKVGAVVDSGELSKREKQEENNNNQRLGRKLDIFTTEEVSRIEKAMADKEDIKTVAKEMGRTLKSVNNKISNFRRNAGLKRGKFTVDERERIKQAILNNEDYKTVAKVLGRPQKSVHVKMQTLDMFSESKPSKVRRFSSQEDLTILDKIIPRLKFQKLSSSGFLSQSNLMELASEIQRQHLSVRERWMVILQPWLLQHYTGTAGFRVERMLTRLVALKFKDERGIDWSEIVSQHKEFAGHTGYSLSKLFTKCVRSAKSQKKGDVSLQEVADYAAEAYRPGYERKDSIAKIAHREKIILYFKSKVDELGLTIVV